MRDFWSFVKFTHLDCSNNAQAWGEKSGEPVTFFIQMLSDLLQKKDSILESIIDKTKVTGLSCSKQGLDIRRESTSLKIFLKIRMN